MNANDKFYARDAHVDAAAVAPLPASRKIYVEGSRPDVRVPMREIAQSDTDASFGAEANPPIVVYDTSAPTPIPLRASTSARACRRSARAGSPSAATRSSSTARRRRTGARGSPIRRSPACASISTASRCAPSPAPTCRRCTTRVAAS
jgi:phosphomethylpyrimidine synthase